MFPTVVKTRLRQAAVGLYLCWLVAVVLSMLGRYTALPTLELARLWMIAGAGIFAVIGFGKILANSADRAKREL